MAKIRELTAAALWLGVLVYSVAGQCSTYIESPGMKGSQQSARTGFQPNSDDVMCKSFCTTSSGCVGAELQVNFCYIYDTPQTLTSDAGYTYFQQNCPTGACSMSQTDNTQGGVTSIQLFLANIDQCSAACLYVAGCQGVSYDGTTCHLYSGTVSDTNTVDDIHFFKTTCQSGTRCCMDATTTMKSDSAPMLSLTSDVTSCENVCLSTSNCVAVYFSQNVCYIYTETTTPATLTGSTYSAKSCPSGDTATDTISLTCTDLYNTSTRVKDSGYVVLVALLIAIAT